VVPGPKAPGKERGWEGCAQRRWVRGRGEGKGKGCGFRIRILGDAEERGRRRKCIVLESRHTKLSKTG